MAVPPMLRRALLAAGGAATVLLMLSALGFGATALGPRFRAYSLASVLILLVFGALTFQDAPRVSANLATPWLGVWQRINIGTFLLWWPSLAVAMLRGGRGAPDARLRP